MADHQPARAAFLGAVIDDVALGAAGRDPDAEAFEPAVTAIPDEAFASAGIGGQRLDDPFGELPAGNTRRNALDLWDFSHQGASRQNAA
jgi:hypothetical protein